MEDVIVITPMQRIKSKKLISFSDPNETLNAQQMTQLINTTTQQLSAELSADNSSSGLMSVFNNAGM